MINLNNIDDCDELNKIKAELLEEAVRLENERNELEESKKRFLRERVKLKNEIDELNRQTLIERKLLREENLFFEKKMQILTDGFRRLEEDRRQFEKEKKAFKAEYNSNVHQNDYYDEQKYEGITGILFKNLNNPLTLRKRYKDLVKIFHPDNLTGDADLMQEINNEYNRRRDAM